MIKKNIAEIPEWWLKWSGNEVNGGDRETERDGEQKRQREKEWTPGKKASSAYKTHTHAKLARLQRNDFCSTTQK